MERRQQHLCPAQGRRSEEEEEEEEGEVMKLCLYECLREVGLEHHYARFTSMGVSRAAHLSALTMEDYPVLGIRNMEDRTRLFHLVQVVKTLDLEGHGYGDDDDYEVDGGDEEDGGFTYDADDVNVNGEDRGHEEDAYDDDVTRLHAASSSRPSTVRRRLDFGCETVDRHQKRFHGPIGAVNVYASHNSGRNDGSVQAKVSAIPLQLDFDNESVLKCGCKGSCHHHRPGVHHHTSDHHTGANAKPDVTRRLPICSSQTRSSPRHASVRQLNPRHTAAAASKYNTKPVGHKDRLAVSRRAKPDTRIEESGTCRRAAKPTPVYESKRTAGYNYGLPLSSPPAPNKKQAGEQRISVCVRKRPLTRAEDRRGEADVVTTQSGECVIVHESKEAVDLTQYILQHRFYFDQVFGEESSNEEVYQRTAYPLVQHMLNGGQATCFAYGQTGAGKTHTMLGLSPGRPGLYALAARDIFAHLSATRTPSPLLLYVSFFEIYCGQLYDLLDHRKRLFAREDGQKVVHIAGLSEVKVDSVSSLLEVISWGTEERTQGVSGVNPLSSRSHALLQIQLRSPEQQIAGRMWFVDLAGSERASDTREPDRQSRMEGAEINQSLLALKECIRSLDQEQSHTPFRQSKLTQVLKDSFVGNSKTCMIANISPGHLASEHTLNTLRYADRVKELRGQGGARGGRGGRRCKRTPSPKRNQSSISSSGGSSGISNSTRGKSPPKKPKLGRQRQAPGPTTPTRRVPTGGAIFCSTPKNSRGEEGRSGGGREGEIGLEHITPVRGSLGIGRQRKEGAGERQDRRREDGEGHGRIESTGHTNRDRNTGAGLEERQPTEERIHSWVTTREGAASAVKLSLAQRETGSCRGEKEKRQRETEEERRWREQRRQVERNRGTYGELERMGEGDLQRVGERDEEREKHLRWYHQQLQQFLPSSASPSPSVHLFPSHSVPPSFSSSNSPSVSLSSCLSVPHSSRSSVSPVTYQGLEEVLGAYRASVQVRADVRGGNLHCPSGEIPSHSETSQSYSNNDEDDHDDTGGVGGECRVPRGETETRGGGERGETEKRRPLEGAGEGEARGRREEWRPTGMEGEQRRWAWVVTTEREGVDRLIHGEALVSSNHDSEERWRPVEEVEEVMDASDILIEGEWSTEEEEEGVGGYGLASAHSNADNNSLFHHLQLHHPPLDHPHPHQRAPAERPLSPACDCTDPLPTPGKLNDLSLESKDTNHTSNLLPLPLQNVNPVHAPQRTPSSSGRQKASSLAGRREISNSLPATPPLPTFFTHTGCKIPAKTLNKYSEDPAILSAALIASLPRAQVHNHPDVKAKTSVLPPEETSADSLSGTMDPLSLSLLQVDRRAATASFLQGEQSIASPCPLEKEGGGDNRRDVKKEKLSCAGMAGREGVEEEDGEFRLSLLELLKVKTHCAPTSKPMIANDHTERKKDMHGGAHHLHRVDITKPSPPVVTLVSLQDQGNSQKPQAQPGNEVLGNKNPASPLRPSPHPPTQTSVLQSISHSVRCLGDAAPNILMPHLATQMPPEHAHHAHNEPASSISTPQSGGDLGRLSTASHSAGSNHPNNSHSSITVNSSAESNSQNQQNTSIIHLSTLEDLDHAQWLVVQAHWEQLEEMEALCRKEGTLLCQQPDMAFGEYVHRLEEIMDRKARCVQSMRSQLQPYLRPSPSIHRHRGDNHHPTT